MLVIPNTFLGLVDAWLSHKGLPKLDHHALNLDPKLPIPLDKWRDYVHQAVALCPGIACGFDMSAAVQFSHVGPLGYVLASSQNFHELLNNYQLFEKWFYGCNWVSLRVSEDEISLSWDTQFTEIDRLLEQLHGSIIVNVISSACPSIGRPLRVDVSNDEKGDAEIYKEAFGCPVHFNSPAFRVIYSGDILNSQVNLDKGDLESFWKEGQRTLHDARRGAGLFARDVQSEILRYLPLGAHIDDVAKGLGLSRRSLQRRLATSGSTYRILVEGIREIRARSLIKKSSLSLSDITFLLGYSEQSAFNHAYKRWTGESPLARTVS